MIFLKRLWRYASEESVFKIPQDAFFAASPDMAWKINKNKWNKRLSRLRGINRPFVLEVKHGGLGDHLIFSGLPELFAKKYNLDFHISNRSVFRDPQIRDFVWGDNPYVNFSDKPGSELNCPMISKHKNYNDAFFDMFDSCEFNSKIKIYYRPKKIADSAGVVLCDLTFGPSGESNGYKEKEFAIKAIEYLRSRYKEKNLVMLMPKDGYPDVSIVEEAKKSKLQIRIQKVENLWHLADLLCSHGEKILLYSGAASLSAALGLEAIVLCNKLSNPYFQYPANKYEFIK